jgi:hypothetical protein
VNADQREAEIRRRVTRWRSMPIGERMLVSGADYAARSTEDFLVGTLDDIRRQLAHTPAAAVRAMPAELTPTTAMHALPAFDARCEAARAAALNAAAAQVDAALAAGVRAGDSPYALRQRAADAIEALRRAGAAPRQPTAPRPPAEPPPFTAG